MDEEVSMSTCCLLCWHRSAPHWKRHSAHSAGLGTMQGDGPALAVVEVAVTYPQEGKPPGRLSLEPCPWVLAEGPFL